MTERSLYELFDRRTLRLAGKFQRSLFETEDEAIAELKSIRPEIADAHFEIRAVTLPVVFVVSAFCGDGNAHVPVYICETRGAAERLAKATRADKPKRGEPVVIEIWEVER
jgi:hypothetical protein